MHPANIEKKEKHPKQDFQVERIAFFTDAVYAIALTLLVIEFKPPRFTGTTTAAELWDKISEMKISFLGILFSFFLIVQYWLRHHELFKHIHDYNRKIVVANMLTLLPIIFFPFTTSFYTESVHTNNTILGITLRFFLFNNIVAGFTMYYFYWIAIKKNKEMCYPMSNMESREFEKRLLFVSLSFVLIFLISFISFYLSFYTIMLFAVYRIFEKRFVKTKLSKPIFHQKPTGNH